MWNRFRLLSLDNVSRFLISTESLAYSDSNVELIEARFEQRLMADGSLVAYITTLSPSAAELIEAIFERRIMVDGFLVAYITTLSLSAQFLKPRSVLIPSLMRGGHTFILNQFRGVVKAFEDIFCSLSCRISHTSICIALLWILCILFVHPQDPHSMSTGHISGRGSVRGRRWIRGSTLLGGLWWLRALLHSVVNVGLGRW